MTIQELYDAHKNDPADGGAGYNSWQHEIFDRIREAISDDEEAATLFEYTLDFAERKSRCAGF